MHAHNAGHKASPPLPSHSVNDNMPSRVRNIRPEMTHEDIPPYQEFEHRSEPRPPSFAESFDKVGEIPIPGPSPLTAHVSQHPSKSNVVPSNPTSSFLCPV